MTKTVDGKLQIYCKVTLQKFVSLYEAFWMVIWNLSVCYTHKNLSK